MADGPAPPTATRPVRPPRVKHWGPTLAILAALGLYLILPDQLAIGPRWLIPAIEGALIILLNLVRAYRRTREETDMREFVIAVIALLNIANMVSVALLVDDLLYGGIAKGRPLLYGAVSVWLTNIIVYGLWFWQLDRGGPLTRLRGVERQPDFQFPQMLAAGQSSTTTAPAWSPGFFDYFYVALTNAAAFSPTDTMPLSRAAKALMGAESLVSIVTVGIVAARAVNILR
ncbi:MAG TPA: hypothetical protein VKR78_02595 [Acidimicrobiales bacterium]|jgi:uncharacterized membrane protein|nr:hypothetical protein [Acidimicrobiales bacterium]